MRGLALGVGPMRLARRRGARAVALALVLQVVLPSIGVVPPGTGILPGAAAAEVPLGADLTLQTNGAGAPAVDGDWYTSSEASAQPTWTGAHRLAVVVPCGWPAGTDVHVDLFSPQVNPTTTSPPAGVSEEVTGTADDTRFRLYGPYADSSVTDPLDTPPVSGLVQDTTYAPTTAAQDWFRFATIDTTDVAAACGTYLLFAETLGDDHNGWRLRVGNGTLGTALVDDADSTPGTNDELVVGVYETTLQQDFGTTGTQCLDLYEHVASGQADVSFHNFDLDGDTPVTYTSPSGAATAGDTSGDGTWNAGNGPNAEPTLARSGDAIPTPEPGWWRITTCSADHNQFVQEGAFQTLAHLEQPPTPDLEPAMSGSPAAADEGDTVVYTVAASNVSSGVSAGAALDVVVTDDLPAGVTFAGCAWVAPATGTCSEAGGTVTAVLDGWIDAGASATVEITVTVDAGADSPLVNRAELAYADAVGNLYGPASATLSTALFVEDVCYVIADTNPDGGRTDGHLLRFDPVTGAAESIGDTGVEEIHAAAVQPGTGTIFAANGGELGTLDATTGAYTAVGSFGASHPDVNALGFDPFTGVLYGADNQVGDDELLTIDPATGAVTGVVAVATGAVASVPGDDVDDLAVSPVDGRLYAVVNTSTAGSNQDHLVVVDPATGAVTDLGAIQAGGVQLEDVAGLGFRTDGTLLGSTGADSGASTAGRVFEIDPATASATEVGELGIGADHEALACNTSGTNTVAGRVFEDIDGDGAFDAGTETATDGVTLTLYRDADGDGTLDGGIDIALASIDTAGGGLYDFTFAATGRLLVVVDTADLPAGSVITTNGGASTGAFDLGTATGTTSAFDVGHAEPGSISGTVFEDVNGDAALDAGDQPLGGVTVDLFADADDDGVPDGAALATATSDVDGVYAFADLDPGTYLLDVDETTVPLTSPVRSTTPDPVSVTLDSGDAASVPVGFYEPVTVGDLVFEDVDGDGIQDAGEPGVADVAVVLLDDGGTTVASATTAADGAYAFTGLPPGTYRVEVTPPAGWVITAQDQGSDDALDSDIDPATGRTALFTLVSGDLDLTQDAGMFLPGSIGDLVFEDVDGDGTRDPGEPGLGGITIELRLDGDGDGSFETFVGDTTSAADGSYAFTGLAAGTYLVDPQDTSGLRLVLTTGNDPLTVAISPGEDVTDADFGYQEFAPAVTLVPDRDRTVEVGAGAAEDVAHLHTLTNTGNVLDSYDLSATSSEGWTVTFRLDDGDGVHEPGVDPVVTTVGPLAPGASADVFAVVTVPAGTARGVVDTTVVTATSQVGPASGGQPVTATVTDTTTVMAPVLDADKTSTLTTAAVPGQRLTYEITITNAAQDGAVATATGVVLDDQLDDPGNGTIDGDSITVTLDGAPQAAGTSFPLALPDVPPGSTVTVAFDVVVSRPLPDGTVITNLAAVTVANPQLYDATDAPVDEVTATTTDVVESGPIPLLTVTASPPESTAVDPGTTIAYTIVVANRADATETWRDIVLTHDLPDPGDATYVAGSAVVDGTVVTGSTNPLGSGYPLPRDLAPGDSLTVTLDLRVADPIVDGTTLTTVAQATGANGGPVFDATTHTVAVLPGVGLTPDGSQTVQPDTQVVYPHLLTNTGNVTDAYTLSAASDHGFATRVVHDLDGDGRLDPGEPEVGTSRTLVPDGLQRLLVVVDVPAGVPSGTVDTVTAVATSTSDPATTTSAFDVTTVVAPELEVVKTAAPSSSAVNPGQLLTYRVEVRNPGGAPTTAVTLVDDTPSTTTYRPGTTRLDGVPVLDGTAGDRNPLSAVNGGLSVGVLAPGQTRTVTFEVAVRSPLPDNTLVVNTARATSAGGLEATGAVSQAVATSAVLDIVKTATPAPGPVEPGGTLAYRVAVRNVGNADATGVVVTDDPPAGTSYVPGSTRLDGTAVPDAASADPNPLATANDGVRLGSLAPGAPARIVTFRVVVDDALPDGTTVDNRARASSAEGITALSATVRHVVDITAGVRIAPDRTGEVEAPGQAVYAHTVTNAGTGTDTIGLAASSSRGWSVTLYRDDDADGVLDAGEGTVVDDTGPLPPGATFALLVAVDVPAGTAPGTTDLTTVRAVSGTDPAVTDSVVDGTRVIAPRLELVKAADPSGDGVAPGGTITYLLTVRNRGSAPARDVTLTDATPLGTTYVTGSAAVDGAPIADGSGNPFGTGFLLGTIEPGDTVTATFAVEVPATATSGDTIVNTAAVAATDLAPVTDAWTHTVTTGPILSIVKTADVDPATPVGAAQRITYTVTVRNAGVLASTGVTVTDATPLNTAYVPGSATVAGSPVADGTVTPNPFEDGQAVGDLLPGEEVALTFTVEVLDSVVEGDVVHNVASAVDASGATATAPRVVHDVIVNPGVEVTPDRTAQAIPGSEVVYAHTVTNTGDVSDSFDLTVQSSRGWLVRVHEDTDGDGSLDAGEPEVATTPLLGAGGAQPILVVVAVPETAVPGVDDETSVTARSVEDPLVADAAVDVTSVVLGALTLAKDASPSSLTPGDRATYTLTVTNGGGAPVAGVTLFDGTPPGTAYVPGSTERDGVRVPDVATGDGNPLTTGLALGELEPDQAAVVTFAAVAEVDPERSVVINAAEVTAGGFPAARAGTVQPYSVERGLDLTPGGQQTVRPGEVAHHPHRLVNTGDLPDEVALEATSAFAFPVSIVADLDGDGLAGAEEPRITDPLSLAPGEAVDLVVAVTVPGDAPGGIEDDLTVVATSVNEPGVSVARTDVTAVVAPFLEVVKSADPAAAVEPGQAVRFSIAVTNTGSETAADVVVTDPLPPGTDYVAGTTAVDGVPVDDAGRHLLGGPGVAVGTLAPGGERLVSFQVAVRPEVVEGAVITNVALASGAGTGEVPSNPVTIPVTGRTALDVVKTVTPAGAIAPGTVLTWTITVANVGSVRLPDVRVADQLPAGADLVPGSVRVDGRTGSEDLVSPAGMAVGALEPGQVVTVTFGSVVGELADGTVLENVATVTNAGTGVTVLSNVAAVIVDRAAVLPATGASALRTLGTATALVATGWGLLYVAHPARRPRPVLDRRRR